MNRTPTQQWERFKQYYREFPSIGLAMDISRIHFTDEDLTALEPKMEKAFAAMKALEGGAIANPDEKRMVGHYWLRASELAPTPELRTAIENNLAEIKAFASAVHQGQIHGERGPFKNLLLIGIGGSALGPQFVSAALGHPLRDKMEIFFFDNTDPDGMDKTLARIITQLGETLVLVISKSGGTKETRNGMLEAKAAFTAAGLNFSKHAVAITGLGSELDKLALKDGWIKRFPMWDWVGGRTSELSVVGLLPAALQGFDIQLLINGAAECDRLTRVADVKKNPSALLAAAWFLVGNGKGAKDMVVLPYNDRLELFSRYLQQLIMESLGKEKDLDGKVVNQGLAVYGNKGSTDQHAYIQQLREGIDNFFVIFLEVLNLRQPDDFQVESGTTSSDYLHGFFLGTRSALSENNRQSVSLTINRVDGSTVGALIALFERSVGLYAQLVNVNAYHQPGVEAGKKAAEGILTLQRKVMAFLDERPGQNLTCDQISSGIGAHDNFEGVFKICNRLGAAGRLRLIPGRTEFERKYGVE